MTSVTTSGTVSGAPPTIVIMPAHNEAADIARVIADVRAVSDFPVIVVDDASTDDTVKLARSAGATVIPLAVQLGAWGATQAGLRYAQAIGCKRAVTMDADGQHEPGALPRLLQPMIDGKADVVIGACTRRGSRLRKLAWALMKRVSGLTPEDLTSGFRVYDRQAIAALASWQATLLEYQDVGVLFLLQSLGLRIEDVEVDMVPRSSGISRIFHSWSSVTYYMAYTLLLSFTKRGLRRRAGPG
jgi:glycosyltransferase involved in cell wall biosynthesis